jgi:hypothetical protein
MHILIRPKRKLYGGREVEMTIEQQLRLNRYLNKYFRDFWQEVTVGQEVTDGCTDD